MRAEQSLMPEPTARLDECSTPDYRGLFGWPVRWQGGAPVLVTGSGIGAVLVPRSLSDQVLYSLSRQGCAGPALSVPTRRGSVVLLLVEADAPAFDLQPLPDGVRVLTAGTTIPLPDERRPDDLSHWIVEPDTHQRWLPSLAAVLTCIRSAGRVPLDFALTYPPHRRAG
ncbi:hypothetical protein [Prauserella muralis]|nr:hypothetical protein [Prauserella muralis]